MLWTFPFPVWFPGFSLFWGVGGCFLESLSYMDSFPPSLPKQEAYGFVSPPHNLYSQNIHLHWQSAPNWPSCAEHMSHILEVREVKRCLLHPIFRAHWRPWVRIHWIIFGNLNTFHTSEQNLPCWCWITHNIMFWRNRWLPGGLDTMEMSMSLTPTLLSLTLPPFSINTIYVQENVMTMKMLGESYKVHTCHDMNTLASLAWLNKQTPAQGNHFELRVNKDGALQSRRRWGWLFIWRLFLLAARPRNWLPCSPLIFSL